MAKKKKEEVVEKATKVNEPKGDVTKVKAKMKMKPLVVEETVTKVDLNKTSEDTDKEQEATGVATDKQSEIVQEVVEEIPSKQETVQDETTPVIEEITTEEKIEKAIEVAEQAGIELPEGIQKVMDFMEDTGGDLNDYVKLNQDYSEMDNQTLLEEYYKQTKPHLTGEEISFLMEDKFSYDEDEDNEKQVKRKKLALKEQVADAKIHLDGLKSKYYKEVKAGSKLTLQQQEAINFYNEQRDVAKSNEIISNDFINKTNKFFGDGFKGFEYNVGNKIFRYNVNDVDRVRDSQIDINNFVEKFLGKDGKMLKESDYHKSLFTAMNADTIASHFYEQGKADAVKNSIAQSKNIDMQPRQELSDNVDTGGIKVRVLNEDASPEFKFKIKQK